MDDDGITTVSFRLDVSCKCDSVDVPLDDDDADLSDISSTGLLSAVHS